MSDPETSDDAADRRAVVLDVLPNGRPDDDRPQHRKAALAYALGETDFRLFELTLTDEADIGFSDRVALDGADVATSRAVDFEGLSSAARPELEYAVEDVIERDERRFVDFYNDAQPITLRLHQLNLLPGIGKKLRNDIIDERKRGPFEDFEDLESRIGGLHRPKEILIERIHEELRDEDLKYRIFVGREPAEE